MFNEVLNQVTGIFDRRFLLNAFFPCLIFWGLLGIVGVVGGGWDALKLLQSWNQQDVILKVLEIVALITLVVFSANILFSQSWSILRFFEGYWQFPFSSQLSRIGTIWHQAHLKQLDVKSRKQELAQDMKQVQMDLNTTQDKDEEQSLRQKMDRLRDQDEQLTQQQFALQEINYRHYPSPRHLNQVMPTRLGNILRGSELYPNDRYQIDAVLIWSRLYHLLPDRTIQIITEALSNLNFTLAIATLSGLFSLTSGIWLLIIKAPGWLFLLCFWGGAWVAWFSYRNALGNAAAYAEQIKVCFDLYRNDLVKQLRLKPAQNPAEEQQQWVEIRQLFYGGQAPSSWTYVESDAKKADSEHG